MDDCTLDASSQLLAANRRLFELRAQAQAKRLTADTPHADAAPSIEQIACRMDEGAQGRQMAVVDAIVAALPPHLGWGGEPLTLLLRGRQLPMSLTLHARQHGETAGGAPIVSPAAVQPPSRLAAPSPLEDGVKLYPDIGLGMLRREETAAGRLWLMLRFLDRAGSGQLRVDIIRNQLAIKSSDLYLCGKRQLRNLLRAGDGLYWTRDDERVWLHSAARVAAGLGVAQLTGRPVALPLTALLQGIGVFRAHLYAAFHSGRAKDAHPRRSAMPIARDTLAGISGVGRSSQRAYEARLGIQTQANFAIGEGATTGRQEERAWRQGQALFTLQDYGGQQGQQGKTYLAWQLPNSYTGQHPQRPRGRQKRINRQLQDLVMKGMPGNDGDMVVDGRRPVLAVTPKRYYANGRLAGQARRSHETGGEGQCYWRQPGAGNGRSSIWRSMGQP